MGKLLRSENAMIAGVAAGIAGHFGWNVNTVRLLWVILAFVGVGSPVLFYLVLWLVMPKAKRKSYEERMQERLQSPGKK